MKDLEKYHEFSFTMAGAHLTCGFEFNLRPVCVGVLFLQSHSTAQVQALIRRGVSLTRILPEYTKK